MPPGSIAARHRPPEQKPGLHEAGFLFPLWGHGATACKPGHFRLGSLPIIRIFRQCGDSMSEFSRERGRPREAGAAADGARETASAGTHASVNPGAPGERRRHSGQGRERRSGKREGAAGGTSLKEVVAEIDRDILRLLLRRHNLLERMRGGRPRLDAAEEKFLREAWQTAVSRVSRDADLSGRFFALMQDAAFLPRPAAESRDADARGPETPAPATERREAFNLAPPRKPLELSLCAPLACRETRAWLFLAAASGQPLRLAPCLMNDPLVDLLKALNQMGAAVTREQDAVIARAAEPLGCPDKVIYVGDSLWNLFLLLALYVGRPSRVKFIGETELKLADFSSMRRFLPQLGARFINVIPRSSGLPARLECSGIVPGRVDLPADVPGELGAALLLAAPFLDHEFALGLAGHPQRERVLAIVLPLLQAAALSVEERDGVVSVRPGAPRLPVEPALPMDAGLASFLLSLPMPLGGDVRLEGAWPTGPEADAAWELLRAMEVPVEISPAGRGTVGVKLEAPRCAARLSAVPQATLERLSGRLAPLPLALAACAALGGSGADVPASALEALRCSPALAADFFSAAGLELAGDALRPAPEPRDGEKSFVGPIWNAPSPTWALALALTACARPARCHGLRLGNPGVLTTLYPGFWALYNALPRPALRQRESAEEAPTVREHRRIRTATAAVLPPEREAEE